MLPMFDDVEPAHSASIMPVKAEVAVVPDTQSLLQEFETVFDAVEMTHGTLTPPQSPPYKPLLTTLEPLAAQTVYTYPEKQPIYLNAEMLDYTRAPVQVPIQMEFPPAIPQTDVAHELAVVDELIRTRAEDMIQYPSSPCSNSSSSSNFGDCSSDDPEWIPETIEPSSDFDPGLKSGRKRSKPYSRSPPEDKKSRKKEQNKNAATRYRMKKKAEVEEVLEEERLLSQTNDGLDQQISDLQREIKYLKGLMRELFRAKGLIN